VRIVCPAPLAGCVLSRTSPVTTESLEQWTVKMHSLKYIYSKQNVTGKVFEKVILEIVNSHIGARGCVVVKALCYKPEGRGFDTR
jgi:hypothetical protein